MTDSSNDTPAVARELLALAASDPVQATIGCTSALQDLEFKWREDLNQIIAVPYAVARHLLTNFEAWKQYIRRPELWSHRKRKKPYSQRGRDPKPRRDKDFGRVLSLVFEATLAGVKGYASSWWYARALEDAFNRGIKPADLPAFIEEHGGLSQMYRDAVKNNPRRKPRPDTPVGYFDIPDPEPEATDDKAGDEGEAGNPGPKPDANAGQPQDGAPALGKPPIGHSPALIRKLEKVMQKGRAKRFMIKARPMGDAMVLQLSQKKSSKKQPSRSSWSGVKIMRDQSDDYASPSSWSTIRPLPEQPDECGDATPSEGWSTCKPWQHPDWRR